MSRSLPMPWPRRLPAAAAVAVSQWRVLLTVVFCFALALAPDFAEARALKSFPLGGSTGVSGLGSRGSRTFEPNGAAPITRSMTATPQAHAPGSGYGYGYGASGSFFQRHPFLTGLFGGWLGAMLFHGLGFGHVFGGLVELLLIGLLIGFLVRRFAGRSFSSWTPGSAAVGPQPRSVGAAAAPTGVPYYRGQHTTVSDADLSAFQGIHATVQEAWSHGDLGRLRQLTTPEMLGYFSEELTRNASQGIQNIVSNVRLLTGDVTESWVEGDLQYATAYMRWSAIDHVVQLGRTPGMPDAVISGDPRTPIEEEEVWTFVRRRGGNWLLSAIQQV